MLFYLDNVIYCTKMEATQRLECTQELYETNTERVCPEQIGFLGICGAKHPVLRGPNKIGRDPQTCNIILNLNSVSRQHAVINVLNSKEFMLMDLDSANKTKLLNKTLKPYIPHPLRNGDTVQFGDIFGIFRLLEENDDLPMTQAIDVPETPVQSRYMSKIKVHTTVIPESPDASDRDDSIISQAHMTNEKTRLSSGQFITPFGKKLSIQPISLPKTDTSTVSSRQSSSSVNHNISLDETFNHSKKNKNIDNIHEMNTQAPNPTVNDSTDSIYTADTQIPLGHGVSSSIHSLDTQIPTTENLPQVRKIEDIEEMQFDLYAANKENDLSIFNAETQPFLCEKDESLDNKSKLSDKELNVCSKPIKHLNKSDEDILFDDIDDECLDDFDSQPLLPLECSIRRLPDSKPELKNPNSSDNPMDSDDIDIIPTQKVEEISFEILSKEPKSVCPTASRRNNRINSDSSTDCDDIESMATQKIPELLIANDITQHKDTKKTAAKRAIRIQSDSSTDCEDINIMPTQKISDKKEIKEKNITDCEDDIKINSKSVSQEVDVVRFENLSAKIVDHDPDKIVKPSLEEMNTQIISIDENAPTKSTNDDSFENQPTQIIDEIIPNNMEANEKPFKEISSPFKIPLKSPLKVKTKEFSKVMIPKDEKAESKSSDHDPNYYNTTQDILDDLCTQRNGSPVLIIVPEKSKSTRSSTSIEKDEIVPCSVEDYKVGAKFANIDRDLSPAESCGKQATKTFAADLSTQEVRHIIGAEVSVDKPKKFPSDSSSDVECTPKKERHFLFTDSDLPNSQEIQNNVIVKHKSLTIESSSESEPEANTEDQFTPIVHKKKKPKTVAKVDLTKRFDVEKLPERIITRVRKPTSKMEEWSSKADKNASTNLLRAKFLTEQEDQIDEDIIIENVKRLKSYGKAKSRKDAKNDTKTEDDITGKEFEHDKSRTISKEIKNEDNSENNGMNSKEKIKVKIEKPKRKESIKHKKSKDKEESSREDHGQLNTNKNKEKAPDVKNTEDANQKKQNDENKPEVSLQSISDCKTSSSTKNTRTRRTVTDKKTTEKQSKSPDNIEKVDYKRKRSTRKREQPKKSTSPAVEIRRSRRHAKAKENKSDSQERQTTQAPISILKKSVHEQSSVYNLSTSGGESPKNLKRSLADDNDLPSPKKTKGFVNNMNINSNNVSLRATPARTMKTHVLFTAFPCGDANHKLEKLDSLATETSGRSGKIGRGRAEERQRRNVSRGMRRGFKGTSIAINQSEEADSILIDFEDNMMAPSNEVGESPIEDMFVAPSPTAYETCSRASSSRSSRLAPNLSASTPITSITATRIQPSTSRAIMNNKIEYYVNYGAVVVTNVLECNVVLTMQVKRTFKLLCAVGLGCPIVGASWVQACIDMHTIVDPWLYLIKDEPAEKRFQFNLERSLKGKRNFLKGYNVSSTPSVLPNASEMKLIVECSGGVWKEGGCNWVCVSSTKDQALWPSLRHRGATIVTTEFILGGVLKQKIEINANKFP